MLHKKLSKIQALVMIQIVFLFLAFESQAQNKGDVEETLLDSGQSDLGVDYEELKLENPAGLWIFFGSNFTYVDMTSRVTGEEDKSGYQIDIQLMGTVYTKRWAYNLGAGWYYNRVSSKNDVANETKIILKAGFLEASPGYRLSHRFWLGPTVLFSFGADLTYAPSINDSNTALLGGFKFAYDMPLSERWRFRATLRGLTDITIDNRNLWTVALGAEIGMPITFRPWQPVGVKEQADLLFTLDEENFYFETNSAVLTERSANFLRLLGGFLAKNPELWDSLRVEGHTDRTGEFYYNLDLSRKRAAAVRTAMLASSINPSKIESEGYGPTRPIDKRRTPDAYKKNRRVEMKFYGVSNPTPINNAVAKARRGEEP